MIMVLIITAHALLVDGDFFRL